MAGKLGLVSLRKVETLDGFVVNWLLCGPFNFDLKLTSCKALGKDYLARFGGEANIKPKAGDKAGSSGPRWDSCTARHGFSMELRNRYAKEGIVSYAAAYLHCPKEQAVKILLGSDDGIKVWLNGKMVWKNHVHRGLGVDNDVFEANLKKGVNIVLLKIEQNFGAYEFCFRVTDPKGRAVKGLKSYLDNPRVRKPLDPAKRRTVSGFEYLCHKYATAERKLAFCAKTAAGYRSWRKKFVAKYKELIGPFPKDCPLRPEITEDVAIEDFRRQKVLLDIEPGFSVPCFVTIPKRIARGQKLPAILCLHGHGNGKSDMVGMNLGTPDEQAWNDSYAMALHAARYARQGAVHAARQGYVTISPDFLAFGERLGKGNAFGQGNDPCSAEFAWAQTVGLIPTTLNIYAVKRCIDYLDTLDFVDGRRVGAMGHSHGGYITTMSMAALSRIKVAVISGFMHTLGAYDGKTWACGSQVVPGLYNYGDLSDVACTFAPRPVQIITGLYDCVTPSPFAIAAFKKIKKAYELAGVCNRAEQFTFPGEHVFQPKAALEWFDRWL
ncbi:MAG: alpha/beta fold hydrolase [Planctomycetota bacterium]